MHTKPKRIVVEVATGLQHSLLLTADGRVYGLGDNARHQITGASNTAYCNSPTLVPTVNTGSTTNGSTTATSRKSPTSVSKSDVDPVLHIGAGGNHSLCSTHLKTYAWGLNDSGQVDNFRVS